MLNALKVAHYAELILPMFSNISYVHIWHISDSRTREKSIGRIFCLLHSSESVCFLKPGVSSTFYML